MNKQEMIDDLIREVLMPAASKGGSKRPLLTDTLLAIKCGAVTHEEALMLLCGVLLEMDLRLENAEKELARQLVEGLGKEG